MGLALFNIFINDMENETERSLVRFADDTKLRGSGTIWQLEGRAGIQRDLERLEEQAWKNPVKFKRNKYTISMQETTDKLKQEWCRLDVWRNFFSTRITKNWRGYPGRLCSLHSCLTSGLTLLWAGGWASWGPLPGACDSMTLIVLVSYWEWTVYHLKCSENIFVSNVNFSVRMKTKATRGQNGTLGWQ